MAVTHFRVPDGRWDEGGGAVLVAMVLPDGQPKCGSEHINGTYRQESQNYERSVTQLVHCPYSPWLRERCGAAADRLPPHIAQARLTACGRGRLCPHLAGRARVCIRFRARPPSGRCRARGCCSGRSGGPAGVRRRPRHLPQACADHRAPLRLPGPGGQKPARPRTRPHPHRHRRRHRPVRGPLPVRMETPPPTPPPCTTAATASSTRTALATVRRRAPRRRVSTTADRPEGVPVNAERGHRHEAARRPRAGSPVRVDHRANADHWDRPMVTDQATSPHRRTPAASMATDARTGQQRTGPGTAHRNGPKKCLPAGGEPIHPPRRKAEARGGRRP